MDDVLREQDPSVHASPVAGDRLAGARARTRRALPGLRDRQRAGARRPPPGRPRRTARRTAGTAASTRAWRTESSPSARATAPRTSLIARCCSELPPMASMSRAFAIAIAAWSANVFMSWMCSSVNGSGSFADDVERPDELAVEQDRGCQQPAVLHDFRGSPRVLGIQLRVRNVDDLSCHCSSPNGRVPVDWMRVLLLVGVHIRLPVALCDDREDVTFLEVDGAVVAVAQPGRRVCDDVEDLLETLRACDGREDVADCALLPELCLDRGDQPRVGDRDRRLVGEGLHELDEIVGERPRYVASDGDGADQLALPRDRHSEERAEPNDLLPLVRVVRVLEHVGDLFGLPADATLPTMWIDRANGDVLVRSRTLRAGRRSARRCAARPLRGGTAEHARRGTASSPHRRSRRGQAGARPLLRQHVACR